jgi:DNA-directed RNA polymerase specialized sigma24 family protein
MPLDSGDAPQAFPTTRGSVIAAIAGADPAARDRAFDALVAVYWRPAYVHLRLKWGKNREDAEDLTQEFFTRALLQGFLAGYDPARGRFRTFLRGCLDHLVANARRDARRLKRGGGSAHLPLDFEGAERDLVLAAPGGSDDPDRRFHQEWLRGLFSGAAADLEARCAWDGHDLWFRIFARHDLEPAEAAARPSYRALAEEFGVPATQINNHLAWARREFRQLVLTRLREVSGSDAEFRSEAQELFGYTP